jgi:large subunit ribosomal protein L2
MKLQNQNQKKALFFIHRAKGRNNRGVITCRHRGGGQTTLQRY